MDVVEISTGIFKRDSKGAVRIWWFETGTDSVNWGWRTNSGIHGGKITTSEWTIVERKNVGRSNETSLSEQAYLEGKANYDQKLARGYFERIEDIDTFDKFKPMLAAKFEDVKFDYPVYAQPKLDGIRCIARADGLWTRTGKQILSCPHIERELKVFFEKNPSAILDGELYNHDLRDNFNKITSLVRKAKPTAEDIEESAALVEYHVYDTYSKENFSDRYNTIMSYGLQKPVVYVETKLVQNKEQLDDLYGSWLELGYEGQMVRCDKPYETKRSKTLLKRKEFLDAEFKVLEIIEGKGNWSGYIKRFVVELPDGRPCGSGVRGSQDVLKKLQEDGITPDWATVRYFTPTPDGMPRFPVVIDWGFGQRND